MTRHLTLAARTAIRAASPAAGPSTGASRRGVARFASRLASTSLQDGPASSPASASIPRIADAQRRGMATVSVETSTIDAGAPTVLETEASSASQPSASQSADGTPLTPWTPYTLRTGVIARKRGMTALWMEDGSRAPVTVLQLDNVQVIAHHPPPSSRTSHPSRLPFARPNPRSLAGLATRDLHILVLGASDVPARRLPAARMGQFAALNAVRRRGGERGELPGKRVVREWRVSGDAVLPVGTTLSAAHFVPGQLVDVTANSIGKGFAGVMKRHGFAGLKATHGVSLTHRSAGSTGQHQDPGRVLPGKKMAGHMGTTRTTTHNLQVLRVDAPLGLVYVRGCVPGADDTDVLVRDAVRGVSWRTQQGMRKGREVGEWLKDGVRGLPTPAGTRANEREMGVEGQVVGWKLA